MGLSPALRRLVRAGPPVAVTGLAVFTAHVGLGLGGPSTDWFFNDFVYNGLELLAAADCLLRAAVMRDERVPWVVMGVGLLCYSAGDIYWTLFLAEDAAPPFPSPADALYLVF